MANEAISKAYHNIKTGYVNRKALYDKLGGKYSHEQIDDFYALDNTTQAFKKLSHKPVLKPILDYDPFKLWELDLIDYNANPDRGYRYIMVVVDDFTKFVWVELMASKDEAHFGEALHAILSRSKKLPEKIMSDGEPAMSGAYVQKLLKVNNIEWVDRRKLHAPTVEKMIQTIKGKLERINIDEPEKGWSKTIGAIVDNINNTVSDTTGVRPVDAVDDADEVRWNLHMYHENVLNHIDVQKLKVGDEVRVAIKGFMRKGSKGNWSSKTYKVIKKMGNRVELEGGDIVPSNQLVKV